ncbi:MAG: MFS transporter [Candidatus Sericytochromatia bacterium]
MEENNINKNPRAVFGWTMYDWANSVYALAITTAIFPSYFSSISKSIKINPIEENIHIVNFLGFNIPSISIYSYTISISYFIIAILSPILGAIADYSGRKKTFMMLFCFIGSLSCSLLYFFDKNNYPLGVVLFLLASLGYAGGNIFNDAFLPEVADPQDYPKISARGYMMGYIGSVIQLIISLALIIKFETFGFADKISATKFSFLLVGIWWFSFAQVTFFSLKELKKEKTEGNVIKKGFEELIKVFGLIKQNKPLLKFLLAFLFYDMGMQTVLYTASLFGTDELHLKQEQLITTILLIQLIAIVGANLFARAANKFGNINTLIVGIVFWTFICIAGYFIKTPNEFYILACSVGMIMGGVQALSRATYSLFVPDTGDNASFFSFYSIFDKIAIILGLLSYGFVNQISQNLRTSILFLVSYFIIGLLIIFSLRKEKLNP